MRWVVELSYGSDGRFDPIHGVGQVAQKPNMPLHPTTGFAARA